MNVYEVVLQTATSVLVEADNADEARDAALAAMDSDPEVMYAFSDNANVVTVVLVDTDEVTQ